jgi:MFS family permease
LAPFPQAYIADITPPATLSQALGTFQGLAAGGAFLVGIPISGVLASKVGLKVRRLLVKYPWAAVLPPLMI